MAQAIKAKFVESGPFHQDLKSSVNRYFEETGKSRRDLPGMYLKTAVILGWFAASYVFLLFFAQGPLALVGGCLSLGLAMAGIGFSIQHDGNHGGYSENPRVNRLMGLGLDLLGGSSYVWSWKHNIFHHSHPNVVGLDADLEVEPFGRFAPEQPVRPFHRFQHLYMWFLYGILAMKWQLLDDFVNVAIRQVGPQKLPRPSRRRMLTFLAGKALFIGWAFVLPLFFHPVGMVLLAYALTAFVLGLALAMTFQLAHCVDLADFEDLPANGKDFTREWAAHQVDTTVDFAPGNRVMSWYLGGLNYQVVHHLFPKICHIHYPALTRIVKEVCARHGVRYRSHRSVLSALGSHVRWLKQMGRPSPATGAERPSLRVA